MIWRIQKYISSGWQRRKFDRVWIAFCDALQHLRFPFSMHSLRKRKRQIAKFITSSTAPEHLDGVADMPSLDSSAHNICTGICAPPTNEHLHVNCALQIEHVQADTSKHHRDIHTSLCSRLSEAGGMTSIQMRWDSAQQQNRASGT